jgi:hypothetical protein
MKLIKIDPKAKTVEAIETSGTLEDMCRIIDCRLIDVCARQDNGDALTVDDEALYVEPQPAAFFFKGYGPIHGVALLTGCDDEGETDEPLTTVEQATRQIEWVGEVHTRPVLFFVGFNSFPFPSASR